MRRYNQLLAALWYGRLPWLFLLMPLEWLFSTLAKRRKLRCLSDHRWKSPVPIIIVGNISVGGVGKTPLVMELIRLLRDSGYSPGVVSRGHGGNPAEYPFVVTASSSAQESGDEPLMIVRSTGCPLIIDPDRVSACRRLLQEFDVDVILSDDGLQHYRLDRDVEIAVIDGERGIGNGHCLPVGPLREPVQRLKSVDFCVLNGGEWQADTALALATYRMTLNTGEWCSLEGNSRQLIPQKVNAVAGIGNPERFFSTLEVLGFEVIRHPFPDHHQFIEQDLCFANQYPLVMTEKDAVKCRAFAAHNRYYLPVIAQLPATFERQLVERITAYYKNRRC